MSSTLATILCRRLGATLSLHKSVNKLIVLAISLVLIGKAAVADNNSLYQVHIPLTTQHATPETLDMYRGHPLLITMFYGSCPDVCPMLIMGMQGYEKQLDAKSRKQLRALVVSFDARRDTAEKLQAIAIMHRADLKRWTFASAGEIDSRKLAALLGFQYREKPDGSYDHSILITLLDAEGHIVATTSKINGDTQFAATLKLNASNPSPQR